MPDLKSETTAENRREAQREVAARRRLESAIAAYGPAPSAALRVREMDLALLSASGLVHYQLNVTSTTLRWEQRVVAFPPREMLDLLCRSRSWERAVRAVCAQAPSPTVDVGRALFRVESRICRVPVGVVAAEARACERFLDVHDAEEAVYRISLAAASTHLAGQGDMKSTRKAARNAGRKMLADVKRSRFPTHVPLLPFQRALAEELAMGRSIDGICSRAETYCDSEGEPKKATELYRHLGISATRDEGSRPRYARVAPHGIATALCAALDLAPEEVGL